VAASLRKSRVRYLYSFPDYTRFPDETIEPAASVPKGKSRAHGVTRTKRASKNGRLPRSGSRQAFAHSYETLTRSATNAGRKGAFSTLSKMGRFRSAHQKDSNKKRANYGGSRKFIPAHPPPPGLTRHSIAREPEQPHAGTCPPKQWCPLPRMAGIYQSGYPIHPSKSHPHRRPHIKFRTTKSFPARRPRRMTSDRKVRPAHHRESTLG